MHDLNHPKVTLLTPEIASKLGLDATFIRFVFAKEKPECFRSWCEDASRGWTCFVPESVDRAYALWSTNANQTLVFVSDQKLSYGKGYHDCPEIQLISQTSQGLLAHLLFNISCSVTSDDEIAEAAEFCGFRSLSELLEYGKSPLLEANGWEERERVFFASIDARSM